MSPPDAAAKPTGPIVVMERLGKSYSIGSEQLSVLRDINLSFEQGQYIAIMGPSGSGKSTLLNLLGCLDKPTSGSYKLGGQDVSLLDDEQLSHIRGQRIGFIFQSYNLIAQLDVIENIEVPMYYQRYAQRRSFRNAVKLANMVGLSDRLRHRPSELSGGQQQRVAIARAIANNPLIILGDEPTGNLDSHSGADILGILDRLHQEGKTLIIVTHDPKVAARAQRVVHLLDGYIEKEVYN